MLVEHDLIHLYGGITIGMERPLLNLCDGIMVLGVLESENIGECPSLQDSWNTV